MAYNIFRIMNVNEPSPDERLSRVFRALSTPARIRIFAGIGHGEACVCHLEALLDLRQAYISQQLMEMRDADLVDTRRDGRYIFYRLTEPGLLAVLLEVGRLFAIPNQEIEALVNSDPLPHCCCPDCLSQLNPTLISQGEIPSGK